MTAPGRQMREGCILVGSLFNEPMRLETVRATGDGAWTLVIVGVQSERFRKVTLTDRELEGLTFLDAGLSFDGDGQRLRLGLQAYSLGIAWEFDPYFGLSISRVDPLLHQLEAVYDYFLASGELRLIEVKGLAEANGAILLTPNERRVAEDRRDCYSLYAVTNGAVAPTLQEPIKDPARFAWREVSKVAHYWLEVSAMTRMTTERQD